MNKHEPTNIKGTVEVIIEHQNGFQEKKLFNNTILTTGKMALANSLANIVDDVYEYYVNRMIFGTNGTSGDVEKFVAVSRVGLFGVTRVQKPVISQIDPDNQTQVIFTSVLTFEDGNGHDLSEMALVMANGDLYSMVTFPKLHKTNQMQITFNWRISIV